MRRRFAAAFLVIGAMLSSCSADWVGEDRAYAIKKEWNSFTNYDFQDAGEKLGVDEVLPTARQKEIKAEEQICSHPNTTHRVTMQDGVNDSIASTHCPLQPYSTTDGARMGNRPDGNGSVIK